MKNALALIEKKLVGNKLVDEEELFVSAHLMPTNSELEDKAYRDIVYCSAPTHQMVRKWLRREYSLFIRITEDMSGNVYEWSVYQKNYGCKASTYVEDSYEQAEETAIKYCLENLI